MSGSPIPKEETRFISERGRDQLTLLMTHFQRAYSLCSAHDLAGCFDFIGQCSSGWWMGGGGTLRTETVCFPHCKRWDGSLWCWKELQKIYLGKLPSPALPHSISTMSYYGTKSSEKVCFKVNVFRQNITTGRSLCYVSRLKRSKCQV